MPKRTDIKKIMIIGSGPITIGQGCEFDYSGTQACKALSEEGYKTILVNSNPATIMTDPEYADRTYIEPVNEEFVEKIIKKERPDALIPTMGGQSGLNLGSQLSKSGILKKYGVELIGADYNAIEKAEDRLLFKNAIQKIGLDVPESAYVGTMEEAMAAAKIIKFPIIVRPAFTLGGAGGSIAYGMKDFKQKAYYGLKASPISRVLLEESVLGWKEYELELMRDHEDNVIQICNIENFDPMGVHTGDSICSAPAQTFTAAECALIKDAGIDIMREIGVNGGVNIQFAVNPKNGKLKVIELNPRVSRSSALASKATGFPIARVATKLAVGYTLDEVLNTMTKRTPASSEPDVDYVVTKVARFTFEKFKDTPDILGPQMKAIGEVMAMGRTFKESLQKAMRSLETGRFGFGGDGKDPLLSSLSEKDIAEKLKLPNSQRLWYIRYALQKGMGIKKINEMTGIDPWFIAQLDELIVQENKLRKKSIIKSAAFPDELRSAKESGFSDVQLAQMLGTTQDKVRALRKKFDIKPVYKHADTCAGEYDAKSSYLYSTYGGENENPINKIKKKAVILGGGPNRIGQGIEFDYCCVHGVFALKEEGYEVSMVNCNPETVSTDYDTADKLYFEPLTVEDILAISEDEGKKTGFIVQFGGQTPLKLAVPLKEADVRIMGTSPESIDRAEDRKKFDAVLTELNIPRPENGTAFNLAEAKKIVKEMGYPVLVRPSYVLGGRAMEIVYDEESFDKYAKEAFIVSEKYPILIDKFLEDAVEVDVDCICDGKEALIAGIMEHIEEAGIHSGDSACVLPPITIRGDMLEKIKQYTKALALKLNVKGLMNVQYAIRNDIVYILEANPRASRTIPFVSKATGVAWAKLATKVMTGKTLKQLKVKEKLDLPYVSVKESVFPFSKFMGADTVLGPEMKSTGEVMGLDKDFGHAYYKSQVAAGQKIPSKGTVFISVKNKDKRDVIFVAKKLVDLGFKIAATLGTANALEQFGIETIIVKKVHEKGNNIIEMIKAGKINLIINTPAGKGPRSDDYQIRLHAISLGVPYTTTMSGAQALVYAIESVSKKEVEVKPLQEYYTK
ncbi:MAG: carbamoyl phosphate synthase large subunit [Candidatus Goldiibacteriota bacterium HGW-Goldbacteria-1]|jgi:carbamoyl-phosphate synthase large subunit|nr:MAG: carbamoyl phosphate synthase large subunit [Candidatus Goldiibacteriota bacterium HGW-Goldbacteria-1]